MFALSIFTKQITELRWIGASKQFVKWYFQDILLFLDSKCNEKRTAVLV